MPSSRDTVRLLCTTTAVQKKSQRSKRKIGGPRLRVVPSCCACNLTPMWRVHCRTCALLFRFGCPELRLPRGRAAAQKGAGQWTSEHTNHRSLLSIAHNTRPGSALSARAKHLKKEEEVLRIA
jgi:hypothetical protein